MHNLKLPKGKIDVVIDTAIAVGYYMECDEQFAIGYMLNEEKFNIKAFYLDLTQNDHWYSCRYNAVKDLLIATDNEDKCSLIKKGGNRRLDISNPEKSESVLDLIERAKKYSKENPLYVFAIGTMTNIGTALLLDPSIAENIVFMWVGGHSFDHYDTDEYNLKSDFAAAKIVLESDVPLILVPCMGVSSKLVVSTDECVEALDGKNALGDYIIDYLHKMAPNEENFKAMKRIIWDGVGPALFLQNEQELVQYEIADRPTVSDDKHWVFKNDGRKIIYAKDINAEKLKEHMFEHLKNK